MARAITRAMRSKILILSLGLSGVLACKSSSTPAPGDQPAGDKITVNLMAKSGSTLTGSAELVDTGSGVKITLDVAGIAPGKHGTHIHEKPDCSSEDAESAGSHYNPHGKDHAMEPGMGHIGDMGNIEIGEDGKGKLEVTLAGANLKAGDPNSLRERAIIVHASPDDGGQPTGNAGGRVGCGEIR